MLYLKKLLFSCILISLLHQVISEVTCPQCDAEKCDQAGFYSCQDCICLQAVTFNCDHIKCGPGQRCVVKSMGGCNDVSACPPSLPQCEAIPVTEEPTVKKEEPKKIPNYDLLDMLGMTPATPNTTESFFEGIDFPFQFEPEGTNKNEDCAPCSDFLCLMAECSSYPYAKCIMENCTCIISFVDSSGFPVDCSKLVDLPVPTTMVLKEEFKTTSSVNKRTTSATEVKPTNQNMLTISISIFCAVLLVCLIAFLIWKLRNVRIRKSKRQESDEEKAEVLKPLSENNNKQDAVCSTGDTNASKVQNST